MSSISKTYLAHRYSRFARGGKVRSTRELFFVLSLLATLSMSILVISILGTLRNYSTEMPTEDKIRATLDDRGENSSIYDRNGILLYTFKDPLRDRQYAQYSEIPKVVIAAALAAEDKNFFIHEGLDYISMIRAAIGTISSGGGQLAGGSTITQQLVKQTLLSSQQTLDRKVKEALISLMVERDYSKEQILEYYLNVSNFGGRVQGIKTAAQTYFSKTLDQLNLNESVFLMALVQSPGEYSPMFAIDKQRAGELSDARRKAILAFIADSPQLLIYLNSGDVKALRAAGLSSANHSASESDSYTSKTLMALMSANFTFSPPNEELKAPHWVFYIKGLLQQSPYNIDISKLYSGGYAIYTTLDYRLQQIAEEQLHKGVDRYGKIYGFENGSLVSIDPNNGQILAMVGSKDYDLTTSSDRFDPKFNVATSIQSLGSSLKPWMVYLGFESGKYTPYSRVQDVAKSYYGGRYKPKDSDGRFLGEMSLHDALLLSRNMPFIEMSYQLGANRLADLMEKIGYRDANEYGLSAVVGGVNETLLDHTSAYVGLANKGTFYKQTAVLHIVNRGGGDVFRSEPVVRYRLNSKYVGQVNSILGDKSFTRDTYYLKFLGGEMLAGKTGTSDGNRDTFYMGYSPKLVTGIWCGNNNNDRMSSQAFGSYTALPIWNMYTRTVLSSLPQYSIKGSY